MYGEDGECVENIDSSYTVSAPMCRGTNFSEGPCTLFSPHSTTSCVQGGFSGRDTCTFNSLSKGGVTKYKSVQRVYKSCYMYM